MNVALDHEVATLDLGIWIMNVTLDHEFASMVCELGSGCLDITCDCDYDCHSDYDYE